METKAKEVIETLERLGIEYQYLDHPPVYTVEEARKQTGHLPGVHCKNLFLRNKKGKRHYLVVMEESKRADLKVLTKKLGEDNLSFASKERLKKYLNLDPGAVSPFGLVNDPERSVNVLVDSDLQNPETIYFHPNVNTATVGISGEDWNKFLQSTGHRIRFMDMD
jgi:Ala-tRNA(Pro) deacylase